MLNFPPNPVVGQQYAFYEWNGTAWVCLGDTDGGGGGGGGLPVIPPGTVLGNNMGIPEPAFPLDGAQTTALLTPFDATDQGVVPPTGAAPVNAVLNADGTWKVPTGTSVQTTAPASPVLGQMWVAPDGSSYVWIGTGWQQLPGINFQAISGDYTVLPTDDYLYIGPAAPAITIILPDGEATKNGKLIRATLLLPAGFQVTFRDASNNLFYIQGREGFNNPGVGRSYTVATSVTKWFSFYFAVVRIQNQITMLWSSNWFMVNEGLPIFGNVQGAAYSMNGQLVAPPVGAPVNATIRTDMVWREQVTVDIATPVSPFTGQLWLNTLLNTFEVYDGTVWRTIATGVV